MSLLLDALRQAEKNKADQAEINEADEAEKNSALEASSIPNSSKIKDEKIVELDVLPELGLSLEESPSSELSSEKELANLNSDELLETEIPKRVLSSQINVQTVKKNTQRLALEDHVADQITDNTQIESLIDIHDKQSESSSESLKHEISSIANSQTNTENVEKYSAPDTEQKTAEIEEKDVDIAELDADVISVLQVTEQGSKKHIYWLLLLLILAVLGIAAYFYSLTIPKTVQVYSDPGPIDDLIEESLLTNNIEDSSIVKVENTKQKPEKKSQDSSITTQEITPVLAVMARPEQNKTETLSKTTAVAVSKKPSISKSKKVLPEFYIEDEENIDYPKKIRIKIKRQQPALIRNLSEAYAAYQRQDYFYAESLYKQTLLHDKSNIDALLGLGAIAEQFGDYRRAQLLYEKVLILNGNHVNANNALIRLKKGQNPAENESRYKTLIEKFPDSPDAYAALGNIYLSKQQWYKAQEAYFNAVERSPDIAYYHYNLAVSLDHLSKKTAAIQYYQKAIQLNNANQAVFDSLAVKQRIQQLQGQGQ